MIQVFRDGTLVHLGARLHRGCEVVHPNADDQRNKAGAYR
jgi:hypothetical protein